MGAAKPPLDMADADRAAWEVERVQGTKSKTPQVRHALLPFLQYSHAVRLKIVQVWSNNMNLEAWVIYLWLNVT